MKLSDYIVEYLIEKNISDVFGYPGGMVTHFMDSFSKYSDKICAHVTYHEQGASFAACGYAQTTGNVGVAYATSGPGATNLITGICNAYFDSIPCLFITGQVNSFESKGNMKVRQRGFQETDIISMVKGVTKYSQYVEDPLMIKYYLDKAFYQATNGRKGPVLLDIPMNIFRAEIDKSTLISYEYEQQDTIDLDIKKCLENAFNNSKRPILLLGNGIKIEGSTQKVRSIIEKYQIPTVTSMIAFDVLGTSKFNMGFIGAYGHRAANFAVAKCDLVISLGSRMDIRQVGVKRETFAPEAKVIRIDIEPEEFDFRVHKNEVQIVSSAKNILDIMEDINIPHFSEWNNICDILKEELGKIDTCGPNKFVDALSDAIPNDVTITTDVGQNQVWIAQSLRIKDNQRVLFSGGHGAMGYSLPAAIGAYYGTRNPVVCFTGDGGLQMNIQELQFVFREQIPIKIIVFNNNALGMIRHFQEMYFESNFYQTKPEGGYNSPNFSKIANAYGIDSISICDVNELTNYDLLTNDKPCLIEVLMNENTYVFPKLEFGKPNQDQEPLLPREKYNFLMSL